MVVFLDENIAQGWESKRKKLEKEENKNIK